MLPDSILRELLKATALQQRLLEAAWPDLSVESKLKLLASLQYTPAYLADMALSDAAEIALFRCAQYLISPSATDQQSRRSRVSQCFARRSRPN